MTHYRIAATLVAAALALAGCVAPKVPYDRTAASHVKTIGLLDPTFPEGPNVVLATTVGQSFGLIGALIDIGMQIDRDTRFAAALREKNFSSREVFLGHLTQTLEARGYAVKSLPAPKREGIEFATVYPAAAETGADAYLDVVVIGYGYVSAGVGPNTPYRPRFGLRARLVNAADTGVLMQDQVIYNYVGPAMYQAQSITLSPDPAHAFDTFDRLIADPDTAVRGMRLAAEQSADAISRLLR